MHQTAQEALTRQDASQPAPNFVYGLAHRTYVRRWAATLVIAAVFVLLGSSMALARQTSRSTSTSAKKTQIQTSVYKPRHFEWAMTSTNLSLPPTDIVNAFYAGPLVGRGGNGSIHVIRHTDDYSGVWYTNLRTQTSKQQWLAPVSLVSANATYLSGNRRFVAVDGAGHAHFIGVNANRSQLWYRSFDEAGLTVETKIRQTTPNAIQVQAMAVERGGMARIAWIESGQVYAMNGVGSTPTVLTSGSFSSLSIFIDENDIAHLLALESGSGFIRYSRALPGGPWDPPLLLSATNNPVIADYAFGPDGSLHILFTTNCPYGYIVINGGAVVRSEVLSFYQGILKRARLGVVSTGDPYFLVDTPGSGTDELLALSGTEWKLLTSMSWPAPLDPVPGDLLVGPDDALTVVAESYANGSETPGGSSLIVANSAVYNAGAAGDQVLRIDQKTGLDVTNGSVSMDLPMFATAGLGPQLPLGLTYNPLALHGATSAVPAGWRLSTEQRVWHSRVEYYGENYQPTNPVINQVWLQTASGQTVTFQSGSQPDEYVVTAREGAFLKLVRNPDDSTWVLTEANGTTHGFSSTGLIDWTKDASNNILDYQYDSTGRLEQVVDTVSRTTSFSYDVNGLLSTITDPSGQAYAFSYYDFGETGGSPSERLLESVTRNRTDAPNETWQFSYHASTNESVACPSPLPGTCPTKRGLLAALVTPRGFSTKYYYEVGGRLAKIVNADNQVMAASYAPLETQLNTACSSLTPSSDDLLTIVTNWRGFASSYETNFEDAMVWRITDPAANVIEQSFDTYRRLTCQKDKRGNVTTYDWLVSLPNDFVRFQLENIHRPGVVNPIHYTYTAEHEVQTVTDSLGNVSSYGYTDSNNPHLVTSIAEPADVSGGTLPVTQMTYDVQGRLKTKTEPRAINEIGSFTTLYDYNDPITGLVTSIDRSGITGNEVMTYNVIGQVVTHKQPAHAAGTVTIFQYDQAHRLKKTTFPATVDHGASSIMNTYDRNGNLLTVTDQLGKVTTYEYDALDRRTKVTRHDGTFSRTEYDPNGNVTDTYDFNNNRTHFVYDALHRVIVEQRFEAVNSRHQFFEYEYDANGNRTAVEEIHPVTNAVQSRTTFQYDQLNRLTQTNYPATVDHGPASVVNTYDDNGNLLTVTDQRGNVSRNCYTNRNLLKSAKRTGGEVDLACSDPAYRTDYAYDLNGNRVTMTVFREDSAVWQPKTTTYEYDATNRLVRTIDPLLRETVTNYDDNGNVTLVTDPANMQTKTEYDALNRQKRVITDFGRKNLTTTNRYDAVGNVVVVSDPNGVSTSSQYDSLHRLVRIIQIGNITTFSYDANGNRTAVIDGNSHSTIYQYDGLNRVIRETDPIGKYTASVYDEFGNLVTKVQSDGATNVTTAFTYDQLHRLKNTVYPTYTVSRSYDASGNLLSITDPNTNLSYQYDSLNRLTRETNNLLNRELRYTFDSFDQRTSMEDYLGAVLQGRVTYQYDDAAQIDKILQGSDQYDFNHHPDGTRQKLTRPNGAVTDYQYDTAKRLEVLANKKPDTSVISGFTYQYDNVGNRTQMDVTKDGSPDHVITYAYDNLYRVISETRAGTVPYAVSWGYDAVGNRLSEIRNGSAKNYKYNGANELVKELIPGVEVVNDDFDAPPLDGWTVHSGSWSEQVGRLHQQAAMRSLLQLTGKTAQAFTASLDVARGEAAAGIAFHIQNPNDYLAVELVRKPIRYDEQPITTGKVPLDCTPSQDENLVSLEPRAIEGGEIRFVRVINGVPQFLTGTWEETDCAWHTLDLEVDEASAVVKVNGRLVLQTDVLPLVSGGVGLTTSGLTTLDTFHWSKSQLTPCTADERGNLQPCGAGTSNYDAENRMTTFITGVTTITYTYDAYGRRIKKVVSDGVSTTTEQYFYDGDDVLLDLDAAGNEVRRYTNGLGIDEKLSLTASAATSHFLTDALGSTRELVDSSNVVQTRFDYEAFGKSTALINNLPTRYQFTGREFEPESGLYYYRARMMDPNVGRFTGRDPIHQIGPGLYDYVGNSPTTFIDPEAMDPELPLQGRRRGETREAYRDRLHRDLRESERRISEFEEYEQEREERERTRRVEEREKRRKIQELLARELEWQRKARKHGTVEYYERKLLENKNVRKMLAWEYEELVKKYQWLSMWYELQAPVNLIGPAGPAYLDFLWRRMEGLRREWSRLCKECSYYQKKWKEAGGQGAPPGATDIGLAEETKKFEELPDDPPNWENLLPPEPPEIEEGTVRRPSKPPKPPQPPPRPVRPWKHNPRAPK